MGLVIKRNENGEYNLTSSVSDECYHREDWISEDEAKKILIQLKISELVDSIIDIELEFPDGYFVNGRRETGTKYCAGSEFRMKCRKENEYDKEVDLFNKTIIKYELKGWLNVE